MSEEKRLPDNNLLYDPKPGFGRIPSFDPRDQNFKMSLVTPLEVTRTSTFWKTCYPLDQGQTSECTAYSLEHLLMSSPAQNKMYLTPHRVYVLNQLWDEWEGEDYEGSSVRAAMKVGQKAGFFSTYTWAFNADTARRFVLMKGPVIFGINWYEGMTNPKNGFIRPKGQLQGGHAIMCRGADDNIKCPDGSRGAFRMFNSWGITWGEQGKAWLSYKDADALIKARGECAAPAEIINTNPINIEGMPVE